jgi:hypothetical protein
MMKNVRWLLPAVCLLAAGCGARGELYSQKLEPLPLLAVDDALVSVVPQTRRVVRVRKGETPRGTPIAAGARGVARVSGELLAVLAGDFRRPLLQLVSVGSGEVRTLELPGPYDAMAFSADGRYGVLTYDPHSKVPDVVARNLNEVAVVDVGAGSVTRLALGTESLAPRSVHFAPPREDRQLVAVALDRGVALFDARAPERAPKRIPTRLSETQPEAPVLEALFSPGGGLLFLRVGGMDDVFAVELGSAGGELAPSVNFLAGGVGLSDIALPLASLGSERQVLAVYAGSQEAMLLDAGGLQDVPRLPLGAPLTSAHVLGDGRVLFHDRRLRTVVAWDVAGGKSGEGLLVAGFDAVHFSDALGTAVFRHPTLGTGEGSALSVVTVLEEPSRLRIRIQPIAVSRTVQADVLDEARGRLYFAPKDQPVLVRLELATLGLDQLSLEAPITALYHLPGADVVAAAHADKMMGDVTLVPADPLEREAAERVQFFNLTDELDRDEEGP